ncbi:MAG: MBL fold metallo-hydrolase [Ruminococcaceae bacterium]|nr:MBL fold metallo-hydrolase [Oscillospiraceae bacterium]
MTVTYLAHSGFLVEWDKFYTLFDWWKGELPPLDPCKPLLVFASHSHEDHFDPRIFKLPEAYPLTRYVLSHDIRLAPRRWERLGMTEEIFSRVTSMRVDSVYQTEAAGEALSVRTISSTDAGVAFLLCAEGKLVYHGGDLNWWHWAEEGKQYCNNMAANYRRAIEKLAACVRDEAADSGCAPVVDAAMAPLDPRLEDAFGMGVEHLLKNVAVRRLFPMHMWGKYDWIERYCRAHPADADKLVRITGDGERFTI